MQKPSIRNPTLDILRGFAILGMVFFTVIYQIAKDLPDILSHNILGMAHIGDFVLPLFIFASGISTAYFLEKRKNKPRLSFLLGVFERIGLLLAVSLFITPFATGSFFAVNEITIILIMFIFLVIVYPFSYLSYLLLSIFLLILYLFLVFHFGSTIFDSHNLGGFHGAFFYLPVSLAALALGKAVIKKEKNFMIHLLLAGLVFFGISLRFFPIDKLRVSPSFMYFSIILGVALYYLFDVLTKSHTLQFRFFSYTGQKPLRYWMLMWIFFMIPLAFYYSVYGVYSARVLSWEISVLLSIFLLVLFGFISWIFDMLLIRLQYKKNR